MFNDLKNYLFLRKIGKKFRKVLKKLYSKKITKYNIKMVKMIYKNIARRYGLSVKQVYNCLPLELEIDYDMELAYGVCKTDVVEKKRLFEKPIKRVESSITLNGKDLTTTTFIHEFGHYLRFLIARIAAKRNKKALVDFRNIVNLVRSGVDIYTKKNDNYFTRGQFTEDEEENFAKSWEQYLRDGKAPNKKHEKLFNDFRIFIFDDMYKRNEKRKYEFYEDLEVKITPERRKFFDSLVSGVKLKKDPILVKLLEFYVYFMLLFLIYKIIQIYFLPTSP